MKIYIVGIGMDGGKTLTAEAGKAIKNADVIIGAKRMTEQFAASGKTVFESWRPDEIHAYINGCGKDSAAVLMSGDCGFFSGAKALVHQLTGYDTEIIPGISTPVYLCAKLGITWQDMQFVSLHGTDANIALNVRRNAKCFFLLGGNVTPADICRRLCGYGMSGVTVHIGARLAYPEECIISGPASELTDVSCDGLCAVITENPKPENCIRTGIPDSGFERGNVPMTKSEIRAVLASKLEICYNDTVWDIGCGTGSVSVECALAAYDGTVFAVDKNDEAAALTELNARKFGCDNIRVIRGAAPGVLNELPRPGKVFIGGANGNISAILDAALEDNNYPKTVITAVSVETLNEAAEAVKAHNMIPEITQISAVRYKKLGKHTMPDTQNPVYIIEGTFL
ncbi:MAG: precorrin-6y C5,15-methyltransferase (decarboxylating) subunit CbiE [Oscillospiraceae bacterium]|nr:precorrin-6y C5,15-methyltransferase (decarboxylating) subunit CbiE [Oscillospiraceae bacterium]